MDQQIFVESRTSYKGVEYPAYAMSNDKGSSLFDLRSIGMANAIHPEMTEKEHAHDFYVILWFFRGKGIHEVDFESYEIGDGMMFFLSPKHLHRFKNYHGGEGISISFTEDFLLNTDPLVHDHIKYDLFYRVKGTSLCTISEATKADLLSIVNLMAKEKEVGKDKFAHAKYLSYLLSLFLITVERTAVWEMNPNKDTILPSYKTYTQFLKCVEEHFCHCHTVRKYTEMMGTSVVSLSKHTQRYANLSPLKLINSRIALEAKRMLCHTDLSIKEISAALGFQEDSYFVKFFQRETLQTPQRYRMLYKTNDRRL